MGAVTEFHPDDKSGVATIVHESTHAEGIDSGLSSSEIEKRDHTPNKYDGAASQLGRGVAGEAPDLSEADAAALVDPMAEPES